MKKRIIYSLVIIFIASLASCTKLMRVAKGLPDMTRNDCIEREIKKAIDSDVGLADISVSLSRLNGSFLELHISADSDRKVSDEAMRRIRASEALQNVARTDPSVKPLAAFEQRIKERFQLSTVKWTADEPCVRGFVCQTTGSSERSANEDAVDDACEEILKGGS